jgi:hypothetical protein
MSTPALPDVQRLDIPPNRPTEYHGQRVFPIGDNNKVDMIGHQALSQQPESPSSPAPAEDITSDPRQ